MSKNNIQKEYWYVVISAILFGGIIFGGKLFSNAGLSMYEISILPLILTILMILPYVLKRQLVIPKQGVLSIIILAGIINAFAVSSQFAAVIMGVPVAMTILLLYTQPIWTILFSKFFLKENITLPQITSCLLIVIGVLFFVNPFSIEHANLSGIIVALISGLGLASWIIAGSILSKRGNEPMNTFFWSMVTTTLFSLAIIPVANLFIKSPEFTHFSFIWPLKIWLYILVFSLTTKIGAHLLYLHGVKKISTADAGIITLIEPISGAILAAIFLHQILTQNVVIGGLFILVGNIIVMTQNVNKTKPNLSENELIEVLKNKRINLSPLFHKALEQVKESHKNQKRDDGSPYLEQHIYPIVADLVNSHQDNRCNEELLIGALLHDVLEDDHSINEKIFIEKFGENIFNIIKPLTKERKENSPVLQEDEKRKINKKMLENIKESSPQTKLIKLADRTNNLACTVCDKNLNPAKTKRYLEETREIYLPFAKTENAYFYKKINKLLNS